MLLNGLAGYNRFAYYVSRKCSLSGQLGLILATYADNLDKHTDIAYPDFCKLQCPIPRRSFRLLFHLETQTNTNARARLFSDRVQHTDIRVAPLMIKL